MNYLRHTHSITVLVWASSLQKHHYRNFTICQMWFGKMAQKSIAKSHLNLVQSIVGIARPNTIFRQCVWQCVLCGCFHSIPSLFHSRNLLHITNAQLSIVKWQLNACITLKIWIVSLSNAKQFGSMGNANVWLYQRIQFNWTPLFLLFPSLSLFWYFKPLRWVCVVLAHPIPLRAIIVHTVTTSKHIPWM